MLPFYIAAAVGTVVAAVFFTGRDKDASYEDQPVPPNSSEAATKVDPSKPAVRTATEKELLLQKQLEETERQLRTVEVHSRAQRAELADLRARQHRYAQLLKAFLLKQQADRLKLDELQQQVNELQAQVDRMTRALPPGDAAGGHRHA